MQNMKIQKLQELLAKTSNPVLQQKLEEAIRKLEKDEKSFREVLASKVLKQMRQIAFDNRRRILATAIKNLGLMQLDRTFQEPLINLIILIVTIIWTCMIILNY